MKRKGDMDTLSTLTGTVGGRYVIRHLLGRGGSASVFLADDSRHDRCVALKVLRPEIASVLGADRFIREVKLAAKCEHPHILPIYDSGEADGLLYCVVPYLEEGSLRDLLKRKRQLPIDEAIGIVDQVASALTYAHQRGVVHRDIKPENILFQGGQVLVADFGIAIAYDQPVDTATTEGVAIGTPAYMSPEQASGIPAVDGRADVYALGCVMFEMLVGHPPFTGVTAQIVLTRHRAETPPPIRTSRSGVPLYVERAVLCALAKSPDERFETPQAFADALRTPPETEPDAPSIAVLPFRNLGGDPADTFLADGLADEIIRSLTKIRGLRVAARTAAFALREKGADVRAIGRALDARTVLDGTVRRAGQRLRVSAELVNVENGYALWAERYDREMEDVFAIQDDIGANIVSALALVLSDAERRAIESPPPANAQAYEFYLRGRQFQHQARRRSLVFARRMFQRAVELEPGYALAFAGIAMCSGMLVHFYGDSEDANVGGAEAASETALRLAPDLAEAHMAQGLARWLGGKMVDAQKAFERAIALDPQLADARYHYGRACFQEGRLDDALRLFETACAVRDDYESRYFLAQTLAALGRARDADRSYRRAVQSLEEHLALNPDDARAITMGGVALCRTGRATEGLEWADRAVAIDASDGGIRYNVACLYALEGQPDRAIQFLEEAVAVGFAHRDWVEHDPDLDPLRDDPRFQELLRQWRD